MGIFTVNPCNGIDDLMKVCLIDIETQGTNVLNERTGSLTREIIRYSISSLNPIDRIIRNTGRKNNLVAQIAETAWVLSGSTELEFINMFLPRAVDFSDDGRTWRAGYGRVSNISYTPPVGFFPGKEDPVPIKISQIKNVIEILKEDPSSRQAYIVIALPGDNSVDLKTKDTPCTLTIQFLIRDNKLHCLVNMRSNDVIWGLTGINYFEWTFLQEALAGILGVEVGIYDHNVGSLHIYDRHFENASDILNSCRKVSKFNIKKHIPLNTKTIEEFEAVLWFYREVLKVAMSDSGIRYKESAVTNFINQCVNQNKDSNIHLYLLVPLLEAIFKTEGVVFREPLERINKNSYLWEGLIKSGKFFLDGYLKTI